jgi:hypothetical protein
MSLLNFNELQALRQKMSIEHRKARLSHASPEYMAQLEKTINQLFELMRFM